MLTLRRCPYVHLDAPASVVGVRRFPPQLGQMRWSLFVSHPRFTSLYRGFHLFLSLSFLTYLEDAHSCWRKNAFSAINSGLLFAKSAAVPPIKKSTAGLSRS